MINFLKKWWGPLFIFGNIFLAITILAIQDIRHKNYIFNEALKGNEWAIRYAHDYYDKNKIPQWVIEEAIKGNESAQKIFETKEEK